MVAHQEGEPAVEAFRMAPNANTPPCGLKFEFFNGLLGVPYLRREPDENASLPPMSIYGMITIFIMR
jgi:hypothetical protein